MLKSWSALIFGCLKKSKGFQKIVTNTGWLVSEAVFRLSAGMVVNVLVARHLGPERYGLLSYAFSVIAFLGTFVYLGLNGLVVRDIVRQPEDRDQLLGTTFCLKFAGSIFAFLVVLLWALFVRDSGEDELKILLIIGLSLFARPFETIEFWFQSQVQSKYIVYAKSTAFFLAAALKVLLVFLGGSLISIAVASGSELILGAILLVLIYHHKGFSLLQWKGEFAKARALLRESWIIILSGALALVNLKIDQIMLRWISGTAEVGLYSVAVTFSEVWYFIPASIVMSVYPGLIELKKSQSATYDKRLQQVFDVLFALALMVATMVTLIADLIIPLLYGEAYSGSASILVIHVWAGIFMFMRAMFSRWVFIEDALYFSLVSHGSGAAMNVILNLILIPKFGGRGGAIATLVSYAVSSYLFLFLHSRTRPLAAKMSRALLLPFRLVLYRSKIWA